MAGRPLRKRSAEAGFARAKVIGARASFFSDSGITIAP